MLNSATRSCPSSSVKPSSARYTAEQSLERGARHHHQPAAGQAHRAHPGRGLGVQAGLAAELAVGALRAPAHQAGQHRDPRLARRPGDVDQIDQRRGRRFDVVVAHQPVRRARRERSRRGARARLRQARAHAVKQLQFHAELSQPRDRARGGQRGLSGARTIWTNAAPERSTPTRRVSSYVKQLTNKGPRTTVLRSISRSKDKKKRRTSRPWAVGLPAATARALDCGCPAMATARRRHQQIDRVDVSPAVRLARRWRWWRWWRAWQVAAVT